MEYEPGDLIEWHGNTYTIVKINGDKVILKQNFSLYTILKGEVSISDISPIKKTPSSEL